MNFWKRKTDSSETSKNERKPLHRWMDVKSSNGEVVTTCRVCGVLANEKTSDECQG
jgi:hypothetical protein